MAPSAPALWRWFPRPSNNGVATDDLQGVKGDYSLVGENRHQGCMGGLPDPAPDGFLCRSRPPANRETELVRADTGN